MNAQNPRAFLSGTALSTADTSADTRLIALAAEWQELTVEINSDRNDDDQPAQDRASDRQSAIEAEMCSTKAQGPVGLRAKAQVLKTLYRCEYDLPDGPNFDDRESLCASILDDLLQDSVAIDPAVGAINAHRQAFAHRMAALGVYGTMTSADAGHDEASRWEQATLDAEGHAWWALLHVMPTTRAGLEAYAEHLRVVATELDEETEDNAPTKQGFVALHSAIMSLGRAA